MTLAWAWAKHSVSDLAFWMQPSTVQLNKYKTDPYFLKNFQSNTTVCSIIHAFGKVYERENVFVLIYRTARVISGSQLLQNM